MLAHLGLVWDPLDLTKKAAAVALAARLQRSSAAWVRAVSAPGLEVWYCESVGQRLDQIYVLPDEQGVVIGKLFRRIAFSTSGEDETAECVTRLDDLKARRLISTRGRDLAENYWGHYIAFLRDRWGSAWVLRDPTRGAPSQYACLNGVDVYFLRLQDYERLSPPPFQLNLTYVAGYVSRGLSHGRLTGIQGVENVLAGERIQYSQSRRKRDFIWNPLEISADSIIEDPNVAASALRRTVRACVRAWFGSAQGVLHYLSGGLDSSIVLACLAGFEGMGKLVCLNEYAHYANADERRFARLAVASSRVELIEREVRSTYSLDALLTLPKMVSPLMWFGDLERARELVRFCQDRGLDAYSTGFGGDEIFLRDCPLPTGVDLAYRKGFDRALLSTLLDDAAYDRVALWKAVRLALQYGFIKRPWNVRSTASLENADRPLLRLNSAEFARLNSDDLWHPLFSEARERVAPGKLFHAFCMAGHSAQSFNPMIPDGCPAELAPLHSQPIIELVLRIPVYVLRRGGRDRAIARRAFKGLMPEELVNRRSKCYGNESIRSTMLTNASVVRELLMNGLLCREGLIDRARLESFLADRMDRSGANTMELMKYLAVEAWARGLSTGATVIPRCA